MVLVVLLIVFLGNLCASESFEFPSDNGGAPQSTGGAADLGRSSDDMDPVLFEPRQGPFPGAIPTIGPTLPPAGILPPVGVQPGGQPFPTLTPNLPLTQFPNLPQTQFPNLPQTFPTLPSQPFPPVNNFPPVNPIPPIVGQQTCVCAPLGQCQTSGSIDGTGVIDIRIVTTGVGGGGTGPLPNGGSDIVTNIVSPPSCAPGLQLCCQGGSYQCGIRYPPVAGSPPVAPGQAPYGAYPWQAVLLSPGNVYAGSGVLIDNRHILTAAHRIINFTTPALIQVRLGEWDAASTREPFPVQEYNVLQAFIHPAFSRTNLQNDVAVLRLTTPVNLGANPAITTGCLTRMAFDGARCWVSGWGRNDFIGGQYQAIQKQVDVPVVPIAQCQTMLRATRLGPNFVLDGTSFTCAGGEPGKDACTGDGGSPLMCNQNGRWYVAGLVAWGIGCATGGVPGVYVNAMNYIPWIQTVIRT